MEIYIKIHGYNMFYRTEFKLRKSNRGYKIATPVEVSEISQARYYKQPESNRHIFQYHRMLKPGIDIHELGCPVLIKKLEQQLCGGENE